MRVIANHEGAVVMFVVTFWRPVVSTVKNARAAEGLWRENDEKNDKIGTETP